jgi:hypothetical protein
METFVAGVHYGDWKGTAAADNAMPKGIYELLEARGVYNYKTQFLLGVELRATENQGKRMQLPSVTALIAERGDYAHVQEFLDSEGDPVPVKRVELELALEEFVGLFKQFEVVLTKKGIDLEGRTYTSND